MWSNTLQKQGLLTSGCEEVTQLIHESYASNLNYRSKDMLTRTAATFTCISRHQRQNHGCIKEVLAPLQCDLNEPMQIP